MQRDTQNLVGGLGLAATGLFASLYAGTHYHAGELANMGEGYFPVVLGAALAVLGALIAIFAWFQKGTQASFQWRNVIYVTAGLVVFGASLQSLGLIPAVLLSVIVSLLADRNVNLRASIIIALGIAVIAYIIFHVGLSMTFPLWPWSA